MYRWFSMIFPIHEDVAASVENCWAMGLCDLHEHVEHGSLMHPSQCQQIYLGKVQCRYAAEITDRPGDLLVKISSVGSLTKVLSSETNDYDVRLPLGRSNSLMFSLKFS